MIKFTTKEKRKIVFDKKNYPTLYSILQKQKKYKKELKNREKDKV